MRNKRREWTSSEDSLILESIVGSKNIHLSAQQVANRINRPLSQVLGRYYNVLVAPKVERRTRRSPREEVVDTFVTKVVNYYDMNKVEHHTLQSAIDSNLNIIATQLLKLKKSEVTAYFKLNKKKVNYLLMHKPELV